jgi:hypothetical protein
MLYMDGTGRATGTDDPDVRVLEVRYTSDGWLQIANAGNVLHIPAGAVDWFVEAAQQMVVAGRSL